MFRVLVFRIYEFRVYGFVDVIISLPVLNFINTFPRT